MNLTVVVSTYNAPRYLGLALDGLAHQNDGAFQCIVADDGSTAETEAVVQSFRGRFADLLHSWQEDKGFRLAASRNRALAASSGDLVAFLDGDCIPSPHYVADVKRLAARHGLATEKVYFQGHRVILDAAVSGAITSAEGLFTARWILAHRRHLSNMLNAWHMGWPAFPHTALKGVRGCNMIFRAEDLRTVNGFDEEFVGWGHEDRDLVSRLYRTGVRRVDARGRALVYHLYHPEHDRSAARGNLARADEERPLIARQGLSRVDSR